MKKFYRKTWWGSLLALFLGSSCCWVSSALIYLGFAGLSGSMGLLIEGLQPWLFGLSACLALATLILFLRRRNSKKPDREGQVAEVAD